ncbi:MAG: protein kinase [Gemmatimonadota bacterium]
MTDPLRDRLAAALGPTYELQRLLGKGGMGSVYLARETALDRLVAVKVLPPEVTGDPETRERFRREARTAAKLTHPHIVPLYTFGEAEGLLWFVMGFVAGETLASKLERTPRLDPEVARRVLGEVADALDYAHGHGIIHRDVKPENILIEDAGGKALLADFGVARASTGGSTLTSIGALIGTPLYMSPEQAAGERDLDGRSDLYSLGVVGYRMLAGRTPFEGGELRAVLAAHITQPVPALSAEIPEALRGTIHRALAKLPEERWRSGVEFRRSLGTGEAITAEEIDRLGSLPSLLSGTVLGAMLAVTTWGVAMYNVPWRGFFGHIPNMLLVGVGFLGCLLPVATWTEARRKRIPFRAAFRIAFWQPTWWKSWWPTRLRRPGDVWDRLPAATRRARLWFMASVILGLPFLPFMTLVVLGRLPPEIISRWTTFILPIAVPLFIGQISIIVISARWAKRRGLDSETANLLFTKPTWNDPFWKRPDIAPLLAPPGGPRQATPTVPTSPAELAAEVRRAASALPPHHASLAQDAAHRAELMAARIGRLDGELTSLAAEVRPEDILAVEKKLAELGAPRADEPEARRAIRAMHEQQLGILRRLLHQLEEGQSRREELAGMLRTLYLQVSELKIATVKLTDADTSGVRAIIERIGHEVEGLREVGG